MEIDQRNLILVKTLCKLSKMIYIHAFFNLEKLAAFFYPIYLLVLI